MLPIPRIAMRRLASALVVLTVLLVAAPSPVRAEQCGEDYMHCLTGMLDLVTMEWQDDATCFGDYVACLFDWIVNG